MRNHLLLLSLAIIWLLTSCSSDNSSSKQTNNSSNSIRFQSLPASQTGLDFRNVIRENLVGKENVFNWDYIYNGAGVGIGDINNDDLPDVYLCSNQGKDQLFLNEGNFKFKNITQSAGIDVSSWSNGVSMVDINRDGFLDIYVSTGGPTDDPSKRHNKFLINKGDLTFEDQAQALGLHEPSRSTQTSFFDYDKDGDLDCFVMNHAHFFRMNLNDIIAGFEKNPQSFWDVTGKLYQNDGLYKFKDVTEKAGLAKWAYGLGMVTTDINGDGFTDIYITNDYSVPDFFFINQRDGTFKEMQNIMTEQISWFGMGCDIADINNDGYSDIAVVDMVSSDHVRNKTLMPSMSPEVFYGLQNELGYQAQYMFNSLQLNNARSKFSNIAQMAGVAYSEWSWAALLMDFDLDGFRDLYISNGTKKIKLDNDFDNYISAEKAKYKGKKMPLEVIQEIYDKVPSGKANNQMYRNNGDLTFKNVAADWGLNALGASNGAAYGDLDNDGDLDLIVSNIDDPLLVYENNADKSGNNYLKIKMPYYLYNTKVELRSAGQKQVAEFHPIRGYVSSVEPMLHFGLGNIEKIDSIFFFWPNGATRILTDVKTNQTLKVDNQSPDLQPYVNRKQQMPAYRTMSAEVLRVDFKHEENEFNDFEKEVLLPYKQSTLGPFMDVADVNNDGREDFFIGGAKGQAGKLYIQQPDGGFTIMNNAPWERDKASEDLGVLFFDANKDEYPDLYICSGGNDIPSNSDLLKDRIYFNQGGEKFVRASKVFAPTTVSRTVTAIDIDKDGDQDLFVGSRHVPGRYPEASASYFLLNNKSVFEKCDDCLTEELKGLVNAAESVDLNNDGWMDVVVAGEWMHPKVLINENGKLSDQSKTWGTDQLKGWWFTLQADDLDSDGNVDLVLGNLGQNTKFHASEKKPFRLYADDFDQNGTLDLVLNKSYKGKYVPVRGFECSSEQMPFLQEKFTSYRSFADASVEEVLGLEGNEPAINLEINEMNSLILKNNGSNSFEKINLPVEAQLAPVLCIESIDYNQDGTKDLIFAGNIFNTEPETPAFDAGRGLVLVQNDNFTFDAVTSKDSGIALHYNNKDLIKIKGAEKDYFIASTNNAKCIMFARLSSK